MLRMGFYLLGMNFRALSLITKKSKNWRKKIKFLFNIFFFVAQILLKRPENRFLKTGIFGGEGGGSEHKLGHSNHLTSHIWWRWGLSSWWHLVCTSPAWDSPETSLVTPTVSTKMVFGDDPGDRWRYLQCRLWPSLVYDSIKLLLVYIPVFRALCSYVTTRATLRRAVILSTAMHGSI